MVPAEMGYKVEVPPCRKVHRRRKLGGKCVRAKVNMKIKATKDVKAGVVLRPPRPRALKSSRFLPQMASACVSLHPTTKITELSAVKDCHPQ